MKFKDYIKKYDWDDVALRAAYIHASDKTMEQIHKAHKGYLEVLKELSELKAKVNKHTKGLALYIGYHPEVTEAMAEEFPKKYLWAEKAYIDVGFKSLNYEKPPKNLCPNKWKDKNHRYLGMAGTDWAELIDMEVIIAKGAKNLAPDKEDILANIIWEITFHGWTNKKVKAFGKMLQDTSKGIQDGTIKTYPLTDEMFDRMEEALPKGPIKKSEPSNEL